MFLILRLLKYLIILDRYFLNFLRELSEYFVESDLVVKNNLIIDWMIGNFFCLNFSIVFFKIILYIFKVKYVVFFCVLLLKNIVKI